MQRIKVKFPNLYYFYTIILCSSAQESHSQIPVPYYIEVRDFEDRTYNFSLYQTFQREKAFRKASSFENMKNYCGKCSVREKRSETHASSSASYYQKSRS